ncbi:MAG TPA: putative Ig domain-containing protein [Verrucomicrobiae bacterium]
MQATVGQTLSNGGIHPGSIAASGGSESWTFTSGPGESIMLRVGTTNFPPRIRVFDGSNIQIADVASGSTVTRDIVISLVTTNGGNYTALVNSATTAGGTYALHFAHVPGEFIVPAQDEGGNLLSGANNPANITVGDLDLWRFTAPAGAGFMVRMGGVFTPWIRVYNTAGTLVSEALSLSTTTRDVVLSGVATNAGTYTVVASSTVSSGVGPYTIHLALAPAGVEVTAGDQGGELVNGVKNIATITTGDLDVWRFNAAAGDMVHLRMGGVFTPFIRLYGPSGELVGDALSPSTVTRDLLLERRATNAGVYIVVTASTVASGAGAYELTLARVPADFTTSAGDEGGLLVNGANTAGNISAGDLDLWRFSANLGDAILLRMGGEFTPKIQLYGPDGALVEEAVSGTTVTRDVSLETRAPITGTYVAIASSTVASGVGAYTLNLAQSPSPFEVSEGDQGGEIISGFLTEGELHTGDMDLWTFEATGGESFMVRIGAQFAPWLRVYGPNGELAGTAVAGSTVTRDVVLNATATNAGPYRIVVAAAVPSGLGTYELHLVRGSGGVEIAADDQGGVLLNGATNLGTVNLGDVDAWTFTATVGDSNVFRVTATNFAPWIRLYGPAGTLVGEFAPPSTVTRSATLIYELTANPGEYTVVLSSGVPGQNGTYAFKQSRWAPDLHVPLNAAVHEGEPVFYNIHAQDPDEPTKPLQFQLLSAPPQAIFALDGATNATIGWGTSEIDGPVTNIVVVKVTDVVNNRSFSRTNSFAVIVHEMNVAPELSLPANQTVNELAPLNVTATATDIDFPPNPLTFSLITPPAGMTINPLSGAINWTPSEAQGPSTNLITIVVTDNSPYAFNEKNLSHTNVFTVVVREVNSAPRVVADFQSFILELNPLNASVSASDDDLPPNQLTFSLVEPPAGMIINPSSGAITWTPTEAQGPFTGPIRVRVTDHSPLAINETQLAATNSFVVTVWEMNTAPVLTLPPSLIVQELEAAEDEVVLRATAFDSDLPANSFTFSLPNPPTGMTIDPTTGAMSWTPSESQGGTTNVITVILTDHNAQAATNSFLSTTNSFTIIVREVNSAPTLGTVSNRNLDEATDLNLPNPATDSDLPANALTYVLTEGPTNATISATGTISWTPTETQGPGTFVFTTVVTDNGAPVRSATNSFTITVTEVNSAPTITALTNQTIRFGELWTNLVTASDSDLPANTLSFSVEQGPTNLTLNPASGALNWTPLQAQVGSHTIRIRASDNGTPSRNAETTFEITVTGVETRMEITRLGTLMQVTIVGNVGLNYRLERSSDLTTWEQQSEFRLNTSPLQYIDPDLIQGRPARLYRLRTIP